MVDKDAAEVAEADEGVPTIAANEAVTTTATQSVEEAAGSSEPAQNNIGTGDTHSADVNGNNDRAKEAEVGEQKTPSPESPESDNPDPAASPVLSSVLDDKKVERDISIKTEETTAEDEPAQSSPKGSAEGGNPIAIVSSNKKSRPPYRYDPDKVTLRFLFANRDGLTVTVECRPGDTVGEVKGALLSVWPEDLPNCTGGDRLRLVCMGKGLLMPDSRTLEDCQVPVFKTHPTPVNVSVKPDLKQVDSSKSGQDGERGSSSTSEGTPQSSQGCACVIL